MGFQNLKIEEIEEKIKNRQKFLKEIVKFVEDITFKIGKEIERTTGSAHTRIVRRLDGFRNFSFLADTGKTMFGGNDFDVWYHPKEKEIDIGRERPVLSVYYQTSDEYKVKEFSKDDVWQHEIRNLIKNKKRILSEIEKEKGLEKEELEDEKKRREENKKRKSLLEEAKKLKLL